MQTTSEIDLTTNSVNTLDCEQSNDLKFLIEKIKKIKTLKQSKDP